MNDKTDGAARTHEKDAARADMLAKARALVPKLGERARATETLRRIPDETVRDFREAGFYRALQPARYGGPELNYGIQVELAAELARGCASSGWDACVTACHAWLIAMYPPEVQDEVWGEDPEAMIGTSFLPLEHEVLLEAGGVRLSGRWGFSSGIDHCDWVVLIFSAEGKGVDHGPDQLFALAPLAECAVEDRWHATGLSGTGSNDIVVKDLFIPEHRLLANKQLQGQPTPGSAHNPAFLYRLPLMGLFSFNLIGPALGAARGAVDTMIEVIRDRRSAAEVRLAEQPGVQSRIAEARSAVDAASLLVMRNLAEINRFAEAGETPDRLTLGRCRGDNSYAAMLCVQAVDKIYPLLGGRGLADDDPVNRAWRDVHAVAHHAALTWDIQGPLYGAVALGVS